MQLFATFVKNKCNFFNFLLQQKLALVITKDITSNIYNIQCYSTLITSWRGIITDNNVTNSYQTVKICHTNTVVPQDTNLIRFGTALLLLVTRPLPRDGGMAEDHGAPEAGQLPRVWTRGHTETESRQRVSGAESVAGQCRMR